jgi:hypothetical protein
VIPRFGYSIYAGHASSISLITRMPFALIWHLPKRLFFGYADSSPLHLPPSACCARLPQMRPFAVPAPFMFHLYFPSPRQKRNNLL